MSGDWLDDFFKPEMKHAYENDKKIWLVIEKFSKKTLGLFKPEFVSTRGM